LLRTVENLMDYLYNHDHELGFCGHDIGGQSMRKIIEKVIATSFAELKRQDVAVHCLGSMDAARKAFDRELLRINAIEVSREEFTDSREFWILAVCVVPSCVHVFTEHPQFGPMECELCGQQPPPEIVE